jgi:hypothetical protein
MTLKGFCQTPSIEQIMKLSPKNGNCSLALGMLYPKTPAIGKIPIFTHTPLMKDHTNKKSIPRD